MDETNSQGEFFKKILEKGECFLNNLSIREDNHLLRKKTEKKIYEIYFFFLLMFSLFDLIYSTIITRHLGYIFIGDDIIKFLVLLLIFLLYSFTSLSKLNYIVEILSWLIFGIYLMQIYFWRGNESKIEELRKEKNYFAILVAHSNIMLIMGFNSRTNLIYLVILLFCDIIQILVINVQEKTFLYKTFFSLFCFCQVFMSTLKTVFNLSHLQTRELPKKFYSDFLQILGLGYIQCKGESFEVEESNDVVKENFPELISGKMKTQDILVSINSENPHDNSFFNNSSSSKFKLEGAKTNSFFFPQKKFLNIENLFRVIKPDSCENFDKTFENNHHKKKLKEMIYEVNQLNNFVSLGTFQVRKNKRQFNIFFKASKIKSGPLNLSSQVSIKDKNAKLRYEFIFIELNKNSDQNLLLNNYSNIVKKISHEIRTPNFNIQKLIERKFQENNLFSNDDHFVDIEKSGKIEILMSVEDLLMIKYLSEISLLTVGDIIENLNMFNIPETEEGIFIHKKYTVPFQNPSSSDKIKSSSLSLNKFVLYLSNLSRTYLYMMNKSLIINFTIQDCIKWAHIIIDEEKLNQILSNLLTNAIKVTPNKREITFNISIIQSCREHNIISNTKTSVTKRTFSKTDKNEEKFIQSERNINKDKNPLALGIRISIEDSGQGLDEKQLKLFNTRTIGTKNEFLDYAQNKGISSGIKLCKKLCDEMGIIVHGELVSDNNPRDKRLGHDVLGSRIVLDIYSEIIFTEEITEQSMQKTTLEIRNIFLPQSDKLLVQYENSNSVDDKESEDANQISQSPCEQSFPERFSSLEKESMGKISPIVDSKAQNLSNRIKSDNKQRLSCFVKKSSRYNDAISGSFKTKSNILPAYKKQNKWKNNFSSKRCLEHTMYSSFVDGTGIANDTVMSSNFKKIELYTGKKINPIILGTEDSSSSDESDLVIILVDDDINISDSIKNLVINQCNKQNINFKLKVLTDGIELLNEIYQDYDKNIISNKLILCDEMMKCFNGSEAYSYMQKFFPNLLKNILFISISAFSDEEHKKKMDSLGIKYVYEKPIKKGHIEFIFNNVIAQYFR